MDISGVGITEYTLNKLGAIFDKATVQELTGLFGEIAFNAIHQLSTDDKTNKRKWTTEQITLAHALTGLCAGELTNAKSSLSASLSAGVNAFVVHTMMKDEKCKKYYEKHPDELQQLSALIGATLGTMTSGDALSGASIATSGTKDNLFFHLDSKEIGVTYEKSFTGHVGVINVCEDGIVEKGDFGRIIDVKLSSGMRSPIGPGQYAFNNESKTLTDNVNVVYMLNADKGVRRECLEAYN